MIDNQNLDVVAAEVAYRHRTGDNQHARELHRTMRRAWLVRRSSGRTG